MTYLYILSPTIEEALAYGRDLGYPTAAIRVVTTTTGLLGTQRPEVHVLSDAQALPNYAALIRAAEARQATIVFPEEA